MIEYLFIGLTIHTFKLHYLRTGFFYRTYVFYLILLIQKTQTLPNNRGSASHAQELNFDSIETGDNFFEQSVMNEAYYSNIWMKHSPSVNLG